MTKLSLPPARFRTPELARARWASDRPMTRWQRILEDLRTWGRDPIYRKSMTASAAIHIIIFFVIPFLFALFNGVEAYRVPKGSGVADPAGMAQTTQEMVKVKVKPKSKPKKTFVVRANTPIIFHVPDLDDSNLAKELEKETDLTYKTDPNKAHEMVAMAQNQTGGGVVKGGTGKSKGRLGKGGGMEGGWPDGSENALVRFIRLNHGGKGWDDNMNATDRSDLNFLAAFAEYSGFKVEKKKFEGYAMAQIAGMDKGYQPPFLYITGTANIPLGNNERKQLREYLMGGGMLFADCGSPTFNSSFRSMADSLIPGGRLVEIADDDPIFQSPCQLPNGAPPLWHHGGNKCMGIKYQGRWAVFYHPGDLKDAFRTGHSGLDPAIVQSAEQTGINVIAYAFSNYLEATKQYRK